MKTFDEFWDQYDLWGGHVECAKIAAREAWHTALAEFIAAQREHEEREKPYSYKAFNH